MRWLRWTLFVLAVLAAAAFAAAGWAMRQSLPQIDGEVLAPALSNDATIERDARGTPVISASTRDDLGFATGFAHGQDRFFQMDLARRLAAGELSELFGAIALPRDRETRRFGFRKVARRVMETAADSERSVVDAYARGVNAGLESLRARPWEYLLLRARPRAWLPEDSVLVVHSMWWQLQSETLTSEIARRRLERAAAQVGAREAGARETGTAEAARALIAFVYAGHSDWDTPNYSASSACVAAACTESANVLTQAFPAGLTFAAAPAGAASVEARAPGSNSWAVAGLHTRSGVALVADDMHLDMGVPAVWYPARLRVMAGGATLTDVTGVTLPGTPAVAAGSNGHVAWGFTNSYGDFADVRWADCRDAAFRVRRETIAVRGEAAVEVEYRDSEFGVLLDGPEFAGDMASGKCLEASWLATRHQATNFGLLALEQARSVDDAVTIAARSGVPGQNMVVGDRAGRIAWTLLGRVPREHGPTRLFGPLTFRDADDHPRIVDPPVGRLWTANQRVVDGELEAIIGDDEVDVGAGGYDLGARARQIRDDLLALSAPATESDMLAIQLDVRARFLARWRELLLALLDEQAVRDAPHRGEFRDLLSKWKPEASIDSVGYRLVRNFRSQTHDALWRGFTRQLLGPQFEARRPGRFEAAVWRLINERPRSIAPPTGGAWRDFLLERVDAAVEELLARCGELADCRHGLRAPVSVRHPLSGSLPLLSSLLDMPTRELAGDHHMPRVQDGSFGASERFAVSPGRESEGYLMLPGGPSGHPLSPFYRSGFEDWAAGRPAPFLPGSVAHKLVLRPTGAAID